MLRAAIIGTGRIGSSLEKDPLRPAGCTHAGSYQLSPDFELVAGADTNPQALQAFGEDWGLGSERLYSDYRRMLSEQRPDIVSVCAYAPQRLEMVKAALECGAKGLWLEKALGCSLHEAQQIGQALQDRGAVGIVDHPRRGRHHYRRVKQLIEEQTFGRLQSVTCHMTHQLIHTGTHAFDVIRYWCGEALEASARLESPPESGETVADQGGSGEILMSSGAQVFVSAYRKKYYIFQFDLIFDNARILLGNDIAKVYEPAPSKLYSGFKELFENPNFDWNARGGPKMLEALARSIRTGEPPLYSVENAVEALRIALALFDSARQGGRRVDPARIDPSYRIENA